MAKFYVFSHITGKYVFDGNFKILERVSNVSDALLSYHFTVDDDLYLLNDFKELGKSVSKDDAVELKENSDYSRISKALQSVAASTKLDASYDARVMTESIRTTTRLIQESVTQDILLTQAINAIDEINKAANLLSKRIREWYSLYFPEASKKISDHERFVKAIVAKDKAQLMAEFNLSESIGADVAERDVSEMIVMANQVSSMYEMKERYTCYVKETVKTMCPNASYYLSEMICARLIACAGSFEKLAGYPASTIQLLGAEKALFRFLRDKGHKSPKYGIMYQHPLMSRVGAKDRGRLARVLGNYAALAFKIDKNSGKLDLEKVEIISKSLKRFAQQRNIPLSSLLTERGE